MYIYITQRQPRSSIPDISRFQFILVKKSQHSWGVNCWHPLSKAALCRVHTSLSPFSKSYLSFTPHESLHHQQRKKRELWMFPRVWLSHSGSYNFSHIWELRPCWTQTFTNNTHFDPLFYTLTIQIRYFHDKIFWLWFNDIFSLFCPVDKWNWINQLNK